jgi:PAS domain S-box-containing protein
MAASADPARAREAARATYQESKHGMLIPWRSDGFEARTGAVVAHPPAGGAWARRLAGPWARIVRAVQPAQHVQDVPSDEQRLRQLAELADDVYWLYEPHAGRFVYVSPAYERQRRRSARALYADREQWLEAVHRDDRALLRDAFGRLAAGADFAIEYRTTLPSGEERWIAEKTLSIGRAAGRPSRVAGVSQDITVRRSAYLDLLRCARRKDEFLATLAHELRNPLAPIRSAAAFLALERSDGPAVERQAIAVVERQVEHLTRLVDDLLDASRIRHGKMRLRVETVRLGDAIDAALEVDRARAGSSRTRLSVDAPDADVWIDGDTVRLTQVFGNLLHNAGKFSADGGVVTLGVRPSADGRQVTVSVRDEGIGIAPERIDSIFELFAQDAAPGRDGSGLGIGLSVVRRLTELHGGSVSARSAGLGKGSEFVVTLPTTQAPPCVSTPAGHAAPARQAPSAARQVLIVDDNRDAAESLRMLLELDGHSVATAFSGRSALEKAARLAPEIVILDIGMPDLGGCDVARAIRADAGLPQPLLVALTGREREQDLKDLRAAGFDRHLVKPVDPLALSRIVGAGGERPGAG